MPTESPEAVLDQIFDTELEGTQVEVTGLNQLTQGVEVPIEDLLEEVLDKPDSEQTEHERKLQLLYKYQPYYLRIRDRIREAYFIGKLIERDEAFACPKCGDIVRIGDWPFCGTSAAGDRHGRVIKRNAKSDTTTAYYINQATGKIWIPGHNQHSPTDKFGKPIRNYVRHEVTTFSDRDKFYKLMDGMAKKDYFSRLEREQKMFEPLLAENRKQARVNIMATEAKSPEASYGREMLERSMARTEAAASAKLNYSPNTMLDAWESDGTNRKDGPDSPIDMMIRQDIMQPTLKERHKKLIGKGESTKEKST